MRLYVSCIGGIPAGGAGEYEEILLDREDSDKGWGGV